MLGDAIQAYAELYDGLVEVGVVLMSSWGGCKEYLACCLLRQHKQFGGPTPKRAIKALWAIGTVNVAKPANWQAVKEHGMIC